jgi:hypothetical protein
MPVTVWAFQFFRVVLFVKVRVIEQSECVHTAHARERSFELSEVPWVVTRRLRNIFQQVI